MRRTILVGLGTAASAVVLHFRRRLASDLRRLRRRFRRASVEERPAFEQRISELEGAIRFLAFDLDDTGAFRLPPPLEPDASDWKVGESHKITLNPSDVMSRFRTGQLPGIELLNPESLRGLDSDNASGGAPANSDLAFAVSKEKICAVLREAIMELLQNRQVLAAPHSEGIRLFLVAGTFGGTGNGAYDCVRDWLMQITEELGVRADIYPILLLPGAHVPKDPRNSFANTFALLKELAANATEFCWKSGADGEAPQRSGYRPPFLLTDSNNSPGTPRIVSELGFGALVGNLLYDLTTTPLGDHIDSQLGDFGVAGVTPTLLGEPQRACTMGYSSVYLDSERQEIFSRSVIAERFTEAALREAPERVLRNEVRAFLEGRALVVDVGRRDLPDRLLNGCATHGRPYLVRLRSLFGRAVESLKGTEVLSEGRNRLTLAWQNCGDAGPALQRQAAEMSTGLGPAVSVELHRLLCDPGCGPASARAWLSIAGGVADAMLVAAGTALGQQQVEINKLEGRIHDAETRFGKRRGSLYHALHGAELSRAGAAYRADLEMWAVSRVRNEAMSAAIQVLNQLRRVVQNELQQTIQPMLAALAACTETLRGDRARAVNHSMEFGCPNGLPLLAGETDLLDLHTRLFPQDDEEKVVVEFFTQLSQLPKPELVLQDAEALGHFFVDSSPSTLLGAKLEELNVVDELRHRFPEPDQLGAALRERDFEAYEWLPLSSTSDQTSGVTLVRLVGIDGNRLEGIRAALEQCPSERGSRYLPVDTGDRQRLAFLQVRGVFPFSDWRNMGSARAYYEAARSAAEVERQHVSPGSRFLPIPGRPLSEEEWAVVLTRAWVAERLVRRDDGAWSLLPGSSSEGPLTLGPAAAIPPQLAYRTAVDLVSAMNCRIRRQGVVYLRRRLADLAHAQSNGGPPLPSRVVLSRVTRRLQAEAEWWERNSVGAPGGAAPDATG